MVTPEEEPVEEETQEMAINLVLALFLVCLVLGAIGAHKLRHTRFYWFPEAAIFLIIGIVVGFFIWLGDKGEVGGYFESVAAFNTELFFILLLPPIIFDAGYSMKRGFFFRNFGAICTLAFIGTTIATAITGILVWLGGEAGFVFNMSLVDALVFGALISAVDPVTVLAVFSELGADPHLYALVFGESVLNDAVSIVLYTALITFQTKAVTAGSILAAFGLFVGIFAGALIIGVGSGILAALLFKHMELYHAENAVLERIVVFCVPYIAYFVAEGLQLSGIVSILFCGISMAHYARPNMSEATRDFSLRLFKLLANTMESIVFLYLGAALFTYPQAVASIPFVIYSFIVILLARAVNVVFCFFLINKWRSPERKLDRRFLGTIWFSGLRGGIAFALAATAASDMKDGEAAKVIETATIIIVILGVVGVGSGVTPLMHWLDLFDRGQHEHKPLEEGEEEEEESSSTTSDEGVSTPGDLTVQSTSLTTDSEAEAKAEEEDTRKRLTVGTSGLEHAGDVEMSTVEPVGAEGGADEEGGMIAPEGAAEPLAEGEAARPPLRPRRTSRAKEHMSRRRAVSTEDAQLLASEHVPSMVKFDRQYFRPRLMRRGVTELNNPELDMSPKEGKLHHHRHRRRRRSRPGLRPRHSDAEVIDLNLDVARARAASDSVATSDTGGPLDGPLDAPYVEAESGAGAGAGDDAGAQDDADVQRQESAPADK